MKRRDFIQNIVRSSAVISMAAMSGYLIFGRNEEDVCNFDFLCKNCKKVKNCQLPEAKGYKEERVNEQAREK